VGDRRRESDPQRAMTTHSPGHRLRALASRVQPLGREVGGDAALTIGASAVMLVANFGTGVVLAHALGPSGRGATAAIMAAPIVIGWLFAIGSVQTLSYFHAREPGRGSELLATWLVLALPLGTIAVIAGELLLPVLFSAQSDSTLRLAREVMPLAAVILLNESLIGIVLGDQRFILFNALRAGSPAAVLAAYLIFDQAGELSVDTAVWIFAIAQVSGTAILLIASALRHGIGRPSRSLARASTWYGIKGHGISMGTFLNARLDLLIMPAFLSASSVGLYSVATNVSWIVVALSGSLWVIVVPVVARSEKSRSEVVWGFLRVSMTIGALVAGALAALAPLALRLVYGPEFVGAASALRILLPGSVLFAAAMVLISGLFAANRPFSATMAQVSGAALTVIGLLLFLDPGGIIAAAVVSSVAYSVVFVVALVLYSRLSRPERTETGSVPGAEDGLSQGLAGAPVTTSQSSSGG